MKILLAQPRLNEDKGPFIPFAQLALAAAVDDVAEVEISGMTADGVLPTVDTIVEQVERVRPDVVGITVGAALAYSASVRLARRIKERNPELPVIAGGHHATFTAKELLATGHVDAVFLGEGEISLREYLVQGDYRRAPSVVYREGETLRSTPRAPLVNMDQVPPPAYHRLGRGMRVLLGAETSRGCPFDCDFCETTVFFGNRRLRKKSTARVVSDLRHIVDATGGGNFLLMDDCFSADMRGHVKPLCEALLAESLPINFCFQARLPDVYRNQDLVPLLARAGFGSVIMGVETIHPETLKVMHKGATYGREEIRHVVKLCKDHGIAFFISVCFGYPGEDAAMVAETIDFLISLDVDCANITLATPVPGSPLYARAKRNGELLSENFDLYNGSTRLLSTISEEVAQAMHQGIRDFYLRPEYLARNLERAIDPATADWRAYTAAGAMSFNIATDKSRPRSSHDWIRLVQGLVLVLQKHEKELDRRFSGTVCFAIEPRARVLLTVESGRPVSASADDGGADFTVSGRNEELLDVLVWCPSDILSACLIGKVRITGATREQKRDFLRWLSDAQTVLRWSMAMRAMVPQVRPSLESWLSTRPAVRERFGRLFAGGGALLVDGGEAGGILVDFQNGSTVSSVAPAREAVTSAAATIRVEPDELDRMLEGGLELLLSVLEREPELGRGSAEEPYLPRDFFSGLARKFRPDRAKDLDLLVHYVIHDSGTWSVHVRNGSLDVYEGEPRERMPQMAIVTSSTDAFCRLISGKANGAVLLHRGEMQLKGLPQTVIRLGSCFEKLFAGRAS